MADTPPSQEELDLRRRARRRLVGAVALALLAVVVLPMVFDPEPRPLGDKVEIRIPDQTEPFVPMPQPVAPEPAPVSAPVEPAPEPAPPTLPSEVKAEAKPAQAAMPVANKTTPPKPEPKPATPAKPETAAKAEVKPAAPAKAEIKPAAPVKPAATAKPDTKPATETGKIAAKPVEAKPAADKSATSGDYFLQLGVFSSQANAEQQVAKARVAGFKSSVVPSGGKFRVRVGPVADRAKALDYQAKLKAKGLDSVLVEP